MILSKESKIIRWAYFFTADYNIPDKTSLCKVFWRCALVTPLTFAALITLCSFILFAIGYLGFYKHTKLVLSITITLTLLGSITRFTKFFNTIDSKIDSKVETLITNVTESTLWIALSAIKAKVCPIITIERE